MQGVGMMIYLLYKSKKQKSLSLINAIPCGLDEKQMMIKLFNCSPI